MSHPIHPILVHFPIAFWSFATLGDLLSLKYGERLSEITGACLILGILMALVAMGGGLFDLLKVKSDSPAMKVLNLHIVFVVITWGLYASSLFLRIEEKTLVQAGVLEVGLSVAGFICLCVTGFLGGRLVYEYGVGVDNKFCD
tara:strand:- start:160683 stop:161111 length:429 start_codon:yes stop_codon:yes gene_type:complete